MIVTEEFKQTNTRITSRKVTFIFNEAHSTYCWNIMFKITCFSNCFDSISLIGLVISTLIDK